MPGAVTAACPGRVAARTASTRWPNVTALSTASTHSPMASTYGTPSPDSPAEVRPISSRSVRSAMPTSQRTPRPSARALAYETRRPATRQNRATTASTPWPVRASQMARPANTAASLTRSRVESRNAPQAPLVPFIRASTPSSMSARTKKVHTTVPANRCPVGNSHSAPATIPHVPVMVIAFGVTGVRASASPTGVSRRVR